MEKEQKVRVTIRMPASLWQRLKHKAVDEMKSLEKVVVESLEKALKEEER